MRFLYLLRHAKSSWDNIAVADHDRPLAPRGEKAAGIMAQHMREAGVVPDHIICSSAVRTRETLALLGKVVKGVSVTFEPRIYEASVFSLLQVLAAQEDTAQRIMMIGHNPGMERLTMLLCGHEGEPGALAALRLKYPTAALATIALDIPSWSAIEEGTGRLQAFVKPRDFV